MKSQKLIEDAVRELQEAGVKCSLKENVRPRMYYSDQHGVCPLVLQLDDCPYDVGFDYDEETGTYSAVYDEWCDHVAKKIGAKTVKPMDKSEASAWGIGHFLQQYTKATILDQAYEENLNVDSIEFLDNGEIEIEVSELY